MCVLTCLRQAEERLFAAKSQKWPSGITTLEWVLEQVEYATAHVRAARRLAADEPDYDHREFVAGLCGEVDVRVRRGRQSVPYGSTTASFDATEAEVLTRRIRLDVTSDECVPVRATGTVKSDGCEIGVEFRLVSFTTDGDTGRTTAIYAVEEAVAA